LQESNRYDKTYFQKLHETFFIAHQKWLKNNLLRSFGRMVMVQHSLKGDGAAFLVFVHSGAADDGN